MDYSIGVIEILVRSAASRNRYYIYLILLRVNDSCVVINLNAFYLKSITARSYVRSVCVHKKVLALCWKQKYRRHLHLLPAMQIRLKFKIPIFQIPMKLLQILVGIYDLSLKTKLKIHLRKIIAS